MGVAIEYKLKIIIKKGKKQPALKAINKLHSLKSLQKHKLRELKSLNDLYGFQKYKPDAEVTTLSEARKKILYSWVKHPPDDEENFKTLKEAFGAWRIVTEDCKMKNYKDGSFLYQGKYTSKYGDQEILLKAISPFCEDFHIIGEIIEWDSGKHFSWINKGGKFTSTYFD